MTSPVPVIPLSAILETDLREPHRVEGFPGLRIVRLGDKVTVRVARPAEREQDEPEDARVL